MSTKHFVDRSPEEIVRLALESIVIQHPDLAIDRAQKSIINLAHDADQNVTLVSGGGAGHEPAHAGFVGRGMLSAAISGNIFASPSVSQITNTIRRVGGKAGVLLIIKNYTGDIFHFSLAAEKSRAALGLDVRVLVVGDDVAVGRERGGKVGRRGLAGTVLVHKILGAAAARNKSLTEIEALGKRVVQGLATVGASLDHVHIPGQATSTHSVLGADQVELGMGIHNEPGFQLLQPQPKIESLIEKLVDLLTNVNDTDRAFVDYFSGSKEVVLLVNNLGAVSILELAAITSLIVDNLQSKSIKLARVYSGTFMTSLDGPGFSITLLKSDSEILSLLDAPTNSLGWTTRLPGANHADRYLESNDAAEKHENAFASPDTQVEIDKDYFSAAVKSAAMSVIAAEPRITKSDTVVGDGDCGLTLKRGAEALLARYGSAESIPTINAGALVLDLAETIENSMDGTSGAIFAIFFSALASAVQRIVASEAGSKQLGLHSWATAAKQALEALHKATPARAGDRTLMDALEPFVDALDSGLEVAMQRAKKGMENTKGMVPAFGRAVYVSTTGWEMVPDPGAEGIVAIAEGLAKGLSKKMDEGSS